MATSPEMTALIAAVAAKDTIDDSVVTFINGIGPQIAAAAGDRAASLALAQDIQTRGTAIAAAIAANTPAAPGDTGAAP